MGLSKPKGLRITGLRQPHFLPTTNHLRTHRTIRIRQSGFPGPPGWVWSPGKRANSLGKKVSPPTHPPRPRIRLRHYSGRYRIKGGTHLQIFVERRPINSIHHIHDGDNGITFFFFYTNGITIFTRKPHRQERLPENHASRR